MTQTLNLAVSWKDAENIPIMAVNQFLLQLSAPVGPGADEAILSLGYLAPPILVGSTEEQRQAAQELHHVKVQPVARVSLSKKRLKELADLLNRLLEDSGPDQADAGG